MSELIGQNWGILGDVERSVGSAVIDRVDESYDSQTIGLTARQLDNIGADYGQVYLKAGDKKVEVDYINAYGEDSPATENGIVISPDLKEELGIKNSWIPFRSSKVELVRESTEKGELLYEVKNHGGEFGQNWGYHGTPQSVVPVFIDEDEEDARIGLTAQQIRNLDAPEGSILQVSYNGEEEEAEVYNAAGIRAVGGKGVRVSEPLVEQTGLEPGEEFSIEKVLSKGQDDQLRNSKDIAELLDKNNRRGQS